MKKPFPPQPDADEAPDDKKKGGKKKRKPLPSKTRKELLRKFFEKKA